MIQFAEVFPDEGIVVSLIREFTWTHFIALLPLKDPLAREFYAEMCRVERWSVRTLRQKINGMLFERTVLSKNSEEVVRQELATLRDGQMTPDMVFRDPYLLDFLGLSGAYSEKDLEAAILREMESFLLEMGSGFCFVERQKRMSVGGDDFYLDLLFYHRHLRRLVAIELKLEKFQPSHKGQMELYLRWLELPPVAVLRERLHRAIEHSEHPDLNDDPPQPTGPAAIAPPPTIGHGLGVHNVNGVPVQASQLSRDIDTTAGPRVCVVATTTQQTTHQILPRQKEKPPKGWPHWTCKAGLLISGIIDYLRVQG